MKMPDHTAVGDVASVVGQRFAVIGMTCSHCEHAIAAEVGRLAGVTAASPKPPPAR